MGLSAATAHDLVGASYAIVRRSWMPCVVYAVVVSGAGFAIDIRGLGERGGEVLVSGLNWAAGYILLVFLMKDAALFVRGQQRGVWSYIGLSILSNFGVLLGLVFLVVPGVILLLRWLPSYAILLSEGGAIVGALRRSWTVTSYHTGALFWASWPALFAISASVALYIVGDSLNGPGKWLAYAAANGCVALATLAWSALGVAAYRYLAASE